MCRQGVLCESCLGHGIYGTLKPYPEAWMSIAQRDFSLSVLSQTRLAPACPAPLLYLRLSHTLAQRTTLSRFRANKWDDFPYQALGGPWDTKEHIIMCVKQAWGYFLLSLNFDIRKINVQHFFLQVIHKQLSEDLSIIIPRSYLCWRSHVTSNKAGDDLLLLWRTVHEVLWPHDAWGLEVSGGVTSSK